MFLRDRLLFPVSVGPTETRTFCRSHRWPSARPLCQPSSLSRSLRSDFLTSSSSDKTYYSTQAPLCCAAVWDGKCETGRMKRLELGSSDAPADQPGPADNSRRCFRFIRLYLAQKSKKQKKILCLTEVAKRCVPSSEIMSILLAWDEMNGLFMVLTC